MSMKTFVTLSCLLLAFVVGTISFMFAVSITGTVGTVAYVTLAVMAVVGFLVGQYLIRRFFS